MLTPGTAVVSIGTDQFSITGLTEVRPFFSQQYLNVGFLMWRVQEGRGGREYLLRTPSTTLRDDWVCYASFERVCMRDGLKFYWPGVQVRSDRIIHEDQNIEYPEAASHRLSCG